MSLTGQRQFEAYVKELRRLGFKRREVYRRYLEKEDYWKITRKQAVDTINAC